MCDCYDVFATCVQSFWARGLGKREDEWGTANSLDDLACLLCTSFQSILKFSIHYPTR